MRGKVIGIEGLIGAGKTEFSKALATSLGSETQLFIEPDEKDNANPYLARYYEDAARWSFTMQIHLLSLRFRIHKQAQWFAMNTGGSAVIDRTYQGDTAFARLQYRNGLVDDNEFATYQNIYHAMTASVLLPTVCIHLITKPETSVVRINKRMQEQTGRQCESSIPIEYLIGLDQEIHRMVEVLDQQGVQIIKLDWDVPRSAQEITQAAQEIAQVILSKTTPDLFLDLHRRTI